jgi:rare lipoprotein A
MTGTARIVGFRSGLALVAALALTACEDGANPFAADGEAGDAAASSQSVELVETDVEAPEVFQVTESGLWDGRPSLGGVWVAHPDVTDPERVIIRNQENGAFVIGALFRRERDNPGPLLQVSSDAAEALQMLPGAPAMLNVTALRREEAPVAAEPTATATFDEAPEIAATTLDPIAGAAAAIDAAEAAGVPGTEISTQPLDPAPAGTETAPAVAEAAAPAAASAAAPSLPPSDLSRPYIQLGIFSVEANADALAQDLRDDGLSSLVVAQESQGKSFWRVLVGPAQSEAELASLLDKVKAQGFADAYYVDN